MPASMTWARTNDTESTRRSQGSCRRDTARPSGDTTGRRGSGRAAAAPVPGPPGTQRTHHRESVAFAWARTLHYARMAKVSRLLRLVAFVLVLAPAAASAQLTQGSPIVYGH